MGKDSKTEDKPEIEKAVFKVKEQTPPDLLADAEQVPGYTAKLWNGRVMWEHDVDHSTTFSAEEARAHTSGATFGV
jgi:hypothetical protein